MSRDRPRDETPPGPKTHGPAWTWRGVLATGGAVVAVVGVLGGGAAHACVGTECFEIWSTEAGGGALTVFFDFAHRKIQTVKSFCLAGTCLYSTIDNGFITTGDPPPDGYYPLADGTSVNFEIVSADPATSVHINGVALSQPGDSALLGTAPTLHNHPSWQISVPDGTPPQDYPLSFKLTTGSTQYAESQVFTVVMTNLPTPTPNAPTPTGTPTPTPTPSPAPPACPGDCNGDGVVRVDELVRGVTGVLDGGSACPAFDTNHDGTITIGELIAAVNAALNGCPTAPTPTATLPATLASIQTTIFSLRCAIPMCHDPVTMTGSLILTAGQAYGQLVGVPPSVEIARDAGMLRVDPGHPENSFLLVKLEGPPPGEGSRMPLTGAPLTDAEIQLIHDWIANGAKP
jgi:hypothetical protein